VNDSFRKSTADLQADPTDPALAILASALGESDNSPQGRAERYKAEFGTDANFISIMVSLLDRANDLDLLGLNGAYKHYFKSEQMKARLSQSREHAAEVLTAAHGEEWATNALFAINYSIRDRLDILNLKDATVGGAYEAFVSAATAHIARRYIGELFTSADFGILVVVWNAAFFNFQIE